MRLQFLQRPFQQLLGKGLSEVRPASAVSVFASQKKPTFSRYTTKMKLPARMANA